MSAGVPWRDPQFWAASAVALAALLFLLRRRLGPRRRGEVGLPCANCSHSAHAARGPAWIRKLRGPV